MAAPVDGYRLVFGEATPAQRQCCYELSATAFAPPLSTEEYLERENFLNEQRLTNGTTRIWCLCDVDEPNRILATCKTVRREVVIRNPSRTQLAEGYCIGSVITDPKYRNLGLASRLLEHVTDWMDNDGEAAVSTLYTSIGDFYSKRGWKMQPCSHATLFVDSGQPMADAKAGLPNTTILKREDISALCDTDTRDTVEELKKLSIHQDDTHIAVLPSWEVVGGLLDRAEFASKKVCGQVPQNWGSLCAQTDSWLYWHHNFRKEQLSIKRLRVREDNGNGAAETVASLLVDALAEATSWNLPKVVIWDPSPSVLGAIQMLSANCSLRAETGRRDRASITSLRRKGSEDQSHTTLHMNEFYAWG